MQRMETPVSANTPPTYWQSEEPIIITRILTPNATTTFCHAIEIVLEEMRIDSTTALILGRIYTTSAASMAASAPLPMHRPRRTGQYRGVIDTVTYEHGGTVCFTKFFITLNLSTAIIRHERTQYRFFRHVPGTRLSVTGQHNRA